MAICDYCLDNSASHLAETETHKFICPVCWTYNLCVEAKLAQFLVNPSPCIDGNCEHRPKLLTKFIRK